MTLWNGVLLAVALSLVSLVSGLSAARAEEVWLDSLDLSRAQQGFGKPQANKSVDGNPIVIAGQKFEHGFGTHSVGILCIDLKGGSTRFQASVGIDDEVAGRPGTVEFEVIGDGKSLFKSGVVKVGETPRPVDVDLTGVKTLMLLVGDAGDGYEFDHAVWADARFTVTGDKPVTTAPTINKEPVLLASGAPPEPRINGTRLVGEVTGKPLLYSIAATGDRPVTFSATDLPDGLKLDSKTGVITGVVTKPGTYVASLHARNDRGATEAKLTIVVGDKVALTPPLGWNSYDAFNDGVTESEFRANADYLAKVLQPHGWDTVVIDYRWYDPGAGPGENGNRRPGPLAMDAFGRLQPAPNRFPSAAEGKGFKVLADSAHALGLKFGIHIMRGIPRQAVIRNLPIEGSDFKCADAGNPKNTCGWNNDMYGVDASKTAGQAWYDSIFRQYAEWGLDFVKVDDLSSPYATLEIEAIRKAIDKCGRAIVFSTSPGETPIQQADHIKSHANMWRMSGDFWDEWRSLNHSFDLAFRWMGVGGQGHWPDEDMITVGHLSVNGRCVGPDRRTNFTQAEQQTMLTLWSILPSPMMLGADLPDNDPWTEALLTNDEVIAVSQDSLVAAATRVSQKDGLEVWSRPLQDGSLAVALFNRGFVDRPAVVRWQDLKLAGKQSVRDLWQQKVLGSFEGQFSALVRPHGTLFLRVSAPK